MTTPDNSAEYLNASNYPYLRPVVYRPNKNEYNPYVLHYGAQSVQHYMDEYRNNGFDFPVSGDTIAVKSERPGYLKPVGNKVAIYRLTRIDGVYTLAISEVSAIRTVSEKLYDGLIDEME